MANEVYKRQLSLLLNILPEVAKETCFALHGGTAINLFVHNMPRLSVDIDLTYIPIEDRHTSLTHISEALQRIHRSIGKAIPGVQVIHWKEIGKLQISLAGAEIKVEVSLVGRGIIGNSQMLPLCNRAQDEFNVFCEMQIVPTSQLYGGKLCAALDRQHPRDLFDVKHLMANEGISDAIKTGFIYCLIGSERPMHEIMEPNLQDQRSAMEHHFAGMTKDVFTYAEYEEVRLQMIEKIQKSLTDNDKNFLLSVADALPDWTYYNFETYPAIAWKLQNLQKLKEVNITKHKHQLEKLESLLKKL